MSEFIKIAPNFLAPRDLVKRSVSCVWVGTHYKKI